jgi:hypothetical protein
VAGRQRRVIQVAEHKGGMISSAGVVMQVMRLQDRPSDRLGLSAFTAGNRL